MFKFWSTTHPEAMKELHPDLGLRNWDDLSGDEKDKVWQYLENFFEVKKDNRGEYYNNRVYFAIHFLNENQKYENHICTRKNGNR